MFCANKFLNSKRGHSKRTTRSRWRKRDFGHLWTGRRGLMRFGLILARYKSSLWGRDPDSAGGGVRGKIVAENHGVLFEWPQLDVYNR